MCKAILRSKKDYEDQYSKGTEYTFFSQDIGEYTTKKKHEDDKYTWLKELPVEGMVDLVKNLKGKGYFVNQIKEQCGESEMVLDSLKPVSPNITTKTANEIKGMADIANLIKKSVDSSFTSEDIRAMAISIFIHTNKE